MKIPNRFNQIEKAQFLPIVVIGMIVMIAFAALIIDGGAVMLNRRTAQNAADAGALAGARSACLKLDAEAVAEGYTIANGATKAEANVSGNTVSVIATVDHPSFFARIFGQNSDVASAQAVASCGPLGAARVLPLAWSCRNAVSETPDPKGCDQKLLDWTTEMQPLITGKVNDATSTVCIGGADSTDCTGGNYVSIPMDFSTNILGKYMYVIMDDEKLSEDIQCAVPDPEDPTKPPPEGMLDCDLDDDGVNDLLGHKGDRSWLDLDGSLEDAKQPNGANALKQWIAGKNVPTLALHSWLGGQTGVAGSVFIAVNDIKGQVALVPIFDALCDLKQGETVKEAISRCTPDVHYREGYDGTDYPVKPSPGAQTYFHIKRFSAFFIACADNGGGQNQCPGARQFICSNIDILTGPNNKKSCDAGNIVPKGGPTLKSIEGYFIKNYIAVGNLVTGDGDYEVDPLVISLIQ